MCIRPSKVILCLFILSFFSLGMSRVPKHKENNQVQEIITRDAVEEFLQRIESDYTAEDLDVFMGLFDPKFYKKSRFKIVLEEYYKEVDRPHIHFVIDAVLSRKDRLLVTVHWYKNAITASGVAVSLRGLAHLELIRRQEGLRIISIKRENPFF